MHGIGLGTSISSPTLIIYECDGKNIDWNMYLPLYSQYLWVGGIVFQGIKNTNYKLIFFESYRSNVLKYEIIMVIDDRK